MTDDPERSPTLQVLMCCREAALSNPRCKISEV